MESSSQDNVIKTSIDGVVIIEPHIFEDVRGYFFESISQKEFDGKVRSITFVHDNESKSSYGVQKVHVNKVNELLCKPKIASLLIVEVQPIMHK